MAAEAARSVRGACRTVPSEPGALRRVSTLYFETDTGDGFRDRGFSKERREPQVAIGLLTDQAGIIYYQYRHDRARRILRTEPTRVRRSPWDRGSCCAR
jgi:hypothetical protein